MKQRLLVLCITAMLIISMFPVAALAADTWDGTADTSWYNAAETTFILTTAEQIAGLATLVNNGNDFAGISLSLDDDLDLDGRQWTPIGTGDAFNGIFDGSGHTVSNLAVGTSASPGALLGGLFGTADTYARIRNLSVEGSVYTAGSGNHAALLAGVCMGDIENCHVSGIVKSDSNAGGLTAMATGSIITCSSDATVTGGSDTGGLVGYYYPTSGGDIFSNCSATGDVAMTSDNYSCGGLIGIYYSNVDITDSYATGDVTTEGERTCAGGFLGSYSTWTSELVVSGCWATGNVAGGENCCAGGFVGLSDRNAYYGCFATGDVSAEGYSYSGGFVGYNRSSLQSCFAAGDVSAKGENNVIGGLVGYSSDPIDTCYASGSVSGGSTNGNTLGGLVGYNEEPIYHSYACGAVSCTGAGTLIGGLIGNCDSGTVDTSYFDTRATGQTSAIGVGSASVTGLDTAQMTGTAASGNMTDLDFTDDYTTKANDSKWYYPQLKVFAESSSSAVRAASLASVTMTPFEVSFDVDGGSAVDSEYGYYTAVPEPTAPTWTGHSFGGWYTGDSFATAYDFSALVTADKTLFAKWTPNTYTVAYNANGGTGMTASGSHTYDTEKALTANGFTRENYTFAGWATSPTGAAVYSNGQNVLNLTAVNGATVTLYAKWTAQPRLTSSDADGKIFVGGRVTLSPNVEGGTWDWDHSFFTATFNSPATFTALKAGTSTITYTVDGVSITYDVTIEASGLPDTGQNFTWVWTLCGAALILGVAAVLLLLRRKAAREKSE